MKDNDKNPRNFFQVSPLVAMIGASAFTACGIFLGLAFSNFSQTGFDASQLPVILNADTAARGDGVSLATGEIEASVDGLFVLDHLTGNLECWVLNTRTGSVAARYRTNVNDELGTQKQADVDYVLTTGRFVFVGGVTANERPGRSICYVADGNTGKVVGYGMRFNRQTMLQGDTQKGELFVVCRGLMRGDASIRDQ